MAVEVIRESQIAADPAAGLDTTQNSFRVTGTLVLSANYGVAAANGDIMDLTAICSSGYAPRWVRVWQEPTAGNDPVIYCFLWARGTTQANGKLVVTDFAGVQIVEGDPYPAALVDDDPDPGIRFEACFARI
jgi:hypothetical protein